MMIFRILLILAFAFLQKPEDNPGKRIIFNDDFEQSFLDLKYWNYDLGDGCPNLCGWGNKEYQHYTKENIFVRDKKLVIRATKEGDFYYSSTSKSPMNCSIFYGMVFRPSSKSISMI